MAVRHLIVTKVLEQKKKAGKVNGLNTVGPFVKLEKISIVFPANALIDQDRATEIFQGFKLTAHQQDYCRDILQ